MDLLGLAMVFFVFLLMLIGGMSIPFAIGAPALLYLYMQGGLSAFKSIGLVSWGSMNSFTLTAVPLFILMAELLQKSGITMRLYRALSQIIAPIPGGLLQANIAGCALFASISGSSVATAASIGSVALPELAKRKYSPRLAAGSLAAGGTLGILIPPSIAMIIYSSFTDTSVAKLFMAGVIPGLVLTAMFMTFVAGICILKPGLVPKESSPQQLAFWAILGDLLPFTVLIVATLGGIYWGVVTPTEAAALGVTMAIVISAMSGLLSWNVILAALDRTIIVSCSILLIVYAANVFSFSVAFAGVGKSLTSWVLGLGVTKEGFLFVVAIMYIIMGCFVDSICMIVITVPLIYPIMHGLGIDPVWFGIWLVLFLELGQITPPLGMNLFVIHGMSRGKLSDVIFGAAPFCVLIVALAVILVFWPEIALWLPEQAAF